MTCADWDPPIPFDQIALPPFPIGALPESIAAFVLAEAEFTQTPPDLAAFVCLAAMATAVHGRVEVRVKPGYCEPLNLYTVVILDPSNRKSDVFRDAMRPLVRHEDALVFGAGPEIAASDARRRIALASARIAEERAAKCFGPDKVGLVNAAVTAATEAAEIVVPTAPRLFADDVTPEKLAELMAQNNGRIAITAPEGGIFKIMAGLYSKSGGANIDVFLKGWSRDRLRVDRMSKDRTPILIDRPVLSMGVAIQDKILRDLTRNAEFRGTGLLARFLYSVPHSLIGWRDDDAPCVPENVADDYNYTIDSLFRVPFPTEPTYVGLSPEAYELRRAFVREVEERLRPGADLAPILDWAGKLVGQTCRMAALIHLAEYVQYEQPWLYPVTDSAMARAIEIATYAIPHAQSVFSATRTNPTDADAKRVLKWVQNRGQFVVSRRDVMRSTKLPPEVIDRSLAILVDRVYLRHAVRPTGSRSRGPEFDVSPYVVERPAPAGRGWTDDDGPPLEMYE